MAPVPGPFFSLGKNGKCGGLEFLSGRVKKILTIPLFLLSIFSNLDAGKIYALGL